ncbi:hypothetical protein [Microcoleus sp. B5-D4]
MTLILPPNLGAVRPLLPVPALSRLGGDVRVEKQALAFIYL